MNMSAVGSPMMAFAGAFLKGRRDSTPAWQKDMAANPLVAKSQMSERTTIVLSVEVA